MTLKWLFLAMVLVPMAGQGFLILVGGLGLWGALAG